MKKNEFLYPQPRYRGEPTPENIVFNAKLQNFSTRVTYICGLEASGKLSPRDAYKQIKAIWKQLKSANKQLKQAQAASNFNYEPGRLKIGASVRVHSPDYVSGLVGEIIAQEQSGRWIIKVKSLEQNQPLLLSLGKADFKLLDFPES